MPAAAKPIRINLLPKEDFDSTLLGQFFHWALSYGRYIIIFTQIIVLSVFFMRFILDREHIELSEAVQQKQALIASIQDVENEIRAIQDRLLKIKGITAVQSTPLTIVNFIQTVTPLDVTYTEFDLTEDRLIISGTSSNLGSLSALLYQLKRANKFTEITLDDIQRNPNSSVEFSIIMTFKPESFAT